MNNIKVMGKESLKDKKMNNCSIRKKIFNKKGSSLVLAIVVIALISILSTLVLSLALNAYRTSVQSKWADEDFYYCEDCLEEVRQTMVTYVNDKIIDNYKFVSSMFTTQPMEYVNTEFRNGIYDDIKSYAAECSRDNIGLLNRTIDLSDHAGSDQSEENIGELRISFNDSYYDDNEIAIADKDAWKYVFKDVKVEYWNGNRTMMEENQKKFYASVTTDIVIHVPSLDFDKEEDYRGSLSYILISGGDINFNGQSKDYKVDVKGNVYAGKDLVVGGNTDVQMLSDYITVLNAVKNSGTYEALGNSVTANIWCKDITLEQSATNSSTVIDANLFVADDLSIEGKNSFVQISGKYFGYGDGNSAILVNGKGSTLDMSEISELVLNGHSFFPVTGLDNYKGQESLATIVSQSLYMVHEDYFDFSKREISIDSRNLSFDNIKAKQDGVEKSLTRLLSDGYVLVTGGVDVTKSGISEYNFAHGYLEDVTSGDGIDAIASAGVFDDNGNQYCYVYWNFATNKKLDSRIHERYVDLANKAVTDYNGNPWIYFSDISLYYNNEEFEFKKVDATEESVVKFEVLKELENVTLDGEYKDVALKYISSTETEKDIPNIESLVDGNNPVKAIMVWNEVESCYDVHLQWNFKYNPENMQSKGEEFVSKCIEKGLMDGFLEKFMDGGYIDINENASVDTKTELYEYRLENGLYSAEKFMGTNGSIYGSSEFAKNFAETYKFYQTTLVPEKYDPFNKKFVFDSNGTSVFNRKVGTGKNYLNFESIDEYFQKVGGVVSLVSDDAKKFKNIIINGNLKISGDGNWYINDSLVEKYTDHYDSFDGIIFVDGNVTIESDVVINGLIISNGNINISKGNYVFDEKLVKGCLDELKKAAIYYPELKDLVSDEFYTSNVDSSANSSSLNAADYIKYENWTRNKDK